eukprot:5475368-Prymnesium_polylepis.1
MSCGCACAHVLCRVRSAGGALQLHCREMIKDGPNEQLEPRRAGRPAPRIAQPQGPAGGAPTRAHRRHAHRIMASPSEKAVETRPAPPHC